MRPEGISKPCIYHAAVYTEIDLELASNKEFVLEGVHVIEYSAVEALRERLLVAKEALEFYADVNNWENPSVINDPDHVAAKALVKLEAK
jgi:hypothetical protein